MTGYVDPSDLSRPMREALLFLAGDRARPQVGNRSPLSGGTTGALERRRLIEWEQMDESTGWKLTDKGRFAVAWLRAQPKGGADDA